MTEPYLGIDFGTTTSSMAWVDGNGQARIIKNEEGEDRTPSVVWYDGKEVLVGKDAEAELRDSGDSSRAVASVKRDLRAVRMLPGRGRVQAVEVAAAILGKLKRDAETLHFRGQAVNRAVVACPAAFSEGERDLTREAATLAGFSAVELIEEPVAAGLAYVREGQAVGAHVLVYDLGGGTFDLAVLAREEAGFRLALPPRGLRRLGGDDFDRALYDWLDARARERLGRSLEADGGTDLRALWGCRDCKERLSKVESHAFRQYVAGTRFEEAVERTTFEALIGELVARTAAETRALLEEAARAALVVETVVLIGGAAKVPLIARELAAVLPLAPHRWDQQDVAVALGAAYFAQTLWAPPKPKPKPKPKPDLKPEPRRTAITVALDRSGDYASLAEAIAAAPENGTIRLRPGEHRLAKPLTLDKPIRLEGVDMEATTLICNKARYVIKYRGKGRWVAEGLTFRHAGTKHADVVLVTCGEIDFRRCRFTGGQQDEQADIYGGGLTIRGKAMGRVTECRLDGNASGLVVTGQARPTLEDNVCEGNGSDGIRYADSAGGVARKNRCVGNELSGIQVSEQAQPTLEGNICEGNKEMGIVYFGTAAGAARKNRCVGNAGSGIYVAEQAKPTLEDNLCEGNKTVGIAYVDTAAGVARKNRCASNLRGGIYALNQAKPTLEENICEGNTGSGIAFGESAAGVARKNHCVGNDIYGIYVCDLAEPTLEGNACRRNKLGQIKRD